MPSKGQTFQVAILTKKTMTNANITIAIRQEVGYLSYLLSNCAIVYLHFHGRKFWNVKILKMVGAIEKCASMTFIEVEICHWMEPLRMFYSMTLTFTFKVKIFLLRIGAQAAIVWCRFASTRMAPAVALLLFDTSLYVMILTYIFNNSRVSFIEVDIRHRMAPWWKLYSVTLIFIFTVWYFPVVHLLYKIGQAADVTGRFASTRTALFVELLLLIWLKCCFFVDAHICSEVYGSRSSRFKVTAK